MRIKKIWKKTTGYVCCAAAGLFLGAQLTKSSPPILDELVKKNDNWYQLSVKDETMTHKYLIYQDEYRTFQLLVREREQLNKSSLSHQELADLCIRLDKNKDGILAKEELK